METRCLIGFRPKSNSSYTAKKVTVLSILDIPFEGEIMSHFQKDDWVVVDAKTLGSMVSTIADIIREELSNAPNIPTELKDQPDDVVWKAAINYIWSMRNADMLKEHIDKVSDHIVVYETFNMVKNMYNVNNGIEIVVREHCDAAYNE